jgi:type IV pilus assembly protein PilP
MSARSLIRLTVVLLPLSLSACSIGMSDLEEFVAQEKAKQSSKIEPIPQIKQYEAFAYDQGNRRDPFAALDGSQRPEGSAGAAGALAPDLHRNREPLEEFPLDALRMLGVIQANGKTYALVKAPDNIVHRVTRGDHLGQNYGAITKVDDMEIKLTEIIPDGFGGWMQRLANLALAQ